MEEQAEESVLVDGMFYVCSGVCEKSYDVAQWGGHRLGIEFEDFTDAKQLAESLNEGRAVLNPDLFSWVLPVPQAEVKEVER